jgi:hypothetical protein
VLKKKSEERSEKKSGDGRAAPSHGELGRRAFLKRSGIAAGSLAALGILPLTGMRKSQAGPPGPGRDSYNAQECLHPLLGRLLGDRQGCQRCVDRAGAGLRQPH